MNFDPLHISLSIALSAYLLGSIPFGLLITTLTGAGDIRKIGSGNIGATNVLRTGNKKLALITLILDFGKGVAAIALAKCTSDLTNIAFASICVVLGHCFPIWLKFKGGKGVATSVGIFSTINFYLGLAFVLIWLMSAAVSRYSSVSAFFATSTTVALGLVILDTLSIKLAIVAICMIVFFRHSNNIKRLIEGKETKIGTK